MIFWKDFILDDVVGPILNFDQTSSTNCREERNGRPSIKTDTGVKQIQETRQEQRPARMAGLSNLDSKTPEDMEVDRCDRNLPTRLRGDA